MSDEPKQSIGVDNPLTPTATNAPPKQEPNPEPKHSVQESHQTNENGPSCPPKGLNELLGSELMKRAERAFHAVYDRMPEDKRRVCRCVEMISSYAQGAYNAAAGANGEGTDANKIFSAGTYAGLYMVQFRMLNEMIGNLGPSETLERMQTIIDWFRKKDWHFDVCIYDAATKTAVTKKAAMVHNDMLRFLDARRRLREALDKAREQKGAK